jgi:hypothetical protein
VGGFGRGVDRFQGEGAGRGAVADPRLQGARRRADLEEELVVQRLEGVHQLRSLGIRDVERGYDVAMNELGANLRAVAPPQLQVQQTPVGLGAAVGQEEECPIDVGQELRVGVADRVDVPEHVRSGCSPVAAPELRAMHAVIGGEVFHVADGGDFIDRAALRGEVDVL